MAQGHADPRRSAGNRGGQRSEPIHRLSDGCHIYPRVWLTQLQSTCYFAADGHAAETSASSGNKWRAHLAPDKTGKGTYQVSFTKGKNVAVDDTALGAAVAGCNGVSGSFDIARTDKTGRDFRAQGRLQYVGKHHLQFAGSQNYFLKAGPDSPETLLAFTDFDNTSTHQPDKGPLKTWAPHIGDWKPGDPTWRDGKGKGLIGALNYPSEKGVNAFSFLSYNVSGDGDNVWPFVERQTVCRISSTSANRARVVEIWDLLLGLGWAGLSSGKPAKPRFFLSPKPGS